MGEEGGTQGFLGPAQIVASEWRLARAHEGDAELRCDQGDEWRGSGMGGQLIDGVVEAGDQLGW
jgi:hypothetical protein